MGNREPAKAKVRFETWVYYEDNRGNLRRWTTITADSSATGVIEIGKSDVYDARRWGYQLVRVETTPLTDIQWEA